MYVLSLLLLIIYIHKNTQMEIIIDMLLPTVLYLTRTVYREQDRMAREFALTRAKLSLPGSAALAAQIRKHRVNDERCRDVDWACIPLVVETYGCWGTEAIQALSRLATRLSTRQGRPKSLVSNEIFGRLSLALVRAKSRAILSCSL